MTATPVQRRKAPARRTQAERSETTQRKIIESALRLIQKQGFQSANLQAIALGAKVTLGAVQHHFGTRQALMERIVDAALAPLADQGEVWPAAHLTLKRRAHAFIDRAWETMYGRPGYVATWSLFFGCKSSTALFKRINAKVAAEDPVFFRRFLDHFPEIEAHHKTPEHFASLVFAGLRGIAVMKLFTLSAEAVAGQLNALAETIVLAGQAR